LTGYRYKSDPSRFRWDYGQLVNHLCAAACLSPGFDFEIAVCEIAAGEEITDDYGTLNPDESLHCECGAPKCRGVVLPDDPVRHAGELKLPSFSANPIAASAS